MTPWRALLFVALVTAGCASQADEAAPVSPAPVVGLDPPAADAPPTGSVGPSSRGLGETVPDFVMLDFNIERNGARNFDSVVGLLRTTAPDVATLQECDERTAAKIGAELGWSYVVDPPRNLAILGPHPMTRIGASHGKWGGVGATVDLGRRGRVHVYDLHLDWQEYGPYLILAGKPDKAILDNEKRVRKHSLDEVFKLMAPTLATQEPTFLAGDFNAPSHLDYDGIAWPTSVACRDKGFVDSFRAVHPRAPGEGPPYAIDDPGVTWSPLTEAEDKAYDRIDFIYANANAKAVSSTTLDARNGIDPWPSDHRAVLSGFTLR